MEGIIVETETIEAADGAKAPRNQTHQNGSLSIAPASTAREIPGWPKAVMKTTPGSGRYAHLVGRPEGCEVTVVCNRGKRIESTTVPVDSWPTRIIDLGVAGVCIDDRGMFRTKPDLASDVETLVHSGVQVVIATEDAEDEFNLVACLSHLKPQLLLHHTMPPEEVWRTVQSQTGNVLGAHQAMIEALCECHPILVHLFLAALCHTRDGELVSTAAVVDSLADAITHVVRTQFPRSHDQAMFLLCLALRGNQVATVNVGRVLESTGLGIHYARRMVLAISSEPVPPELDAALWPRLRTHLDADTFDTARRALMPLLNDGVVDEVHHLGLLELFTGDTDSCLTPEVADVIRRVADAADTCGRSHIMRALPRFLEDESAGKAATRLAAICSDLDLTALGAALEVLDAADAVSEAAYDVLSPLVALEHPVLSAHLAEKALGTLAPDDPRTATAALSWIMTSPATACAEPERRWRTLRRIVAMAHGDHPSAPVIRAGMAVLHAFTRRSAGAQLRELVAHQGSSPGGLPLMACCLAGLATCLNNMTDEAAMWCWRARSFASTRRAERAWVLIVHSLVAFHRRDTKLASELLARVAETTTAMRASTVGRFCELATHYLRKDPGDSERSTLLDEEAHVVLRVFATHCAASLDHRRGSVQLAIDKHFATGRTLASARLTNPVILDWRQQLRTIFVSCHEDAIAECLRNDICAAEESWRSLNDLSNAPNHREDIRSGAEDESRRLSVSEQKVAEQVAAGCTNAQAAEALFLSKRTVDTHLRNIYRRLGISNRFELIEFVKKNYRERE
ncbi:helix-turn-helix transcriptional regulator [Arachnia propionica]|uniref:helix-turn-helix transcriptional regulator n=1 Tax=Arachnia propionica TaxID=1750 RepID=UPI000F6DC0C3|nr:helix-turn-helix transcriptional regulator [Arachnia propionica]VEJ57318.1 CsgBAC operon transcriptional regulatory protein [Arachnia propionica]